MLIRELRIFSRIIKGSIALVVLVLFSNFGVYAHQWIEKIECTEQKGPRLLSADWVRGKTYDVSFKGPDQSLLFHEKGKVAIQDTAKNGTLFDEVKLSLKEDGTLTFLLPDPGVTGAKEQSRARNVSAKLIFKKDEVSLGCDITSVPSVDAAPPRRKNEAH